MADVRQMGQGRLAQLLGTNFGGGGGVIGRSPRLLGNAANQNTPPSKQVAPLTSRSLYTGDRVTLNEDGSYSLFSKQGNYFGSDRNLFNLLKRFMPQKDLVTKEGVNRFEWSFLRKD